MNKSELFADVVRPLVEARDKAQSELNELVEQREDLSGKINQQRETVKEAERMLRQIDPEQFPAPEKPQRRVKAGASISDERFDSAVRFVREWFDNDHDTITQSDLIINQPSFNPWMASAAFRKMREMGILRLIGQRGKSKHYRLTKQAMKTNNESESNGTVEQPAVG